MVSGGTLFWAGVPAPGLALIGEGPVHTSATAVRIAAILRTLDMVKSLLSPRTINASSESGGYEDGDCLGSGGGVRGEGKPDIQSVSQSPMEAPRHGNLERTKEELDPMSTNPSPGFQTDVSIPHRTQDPYICC
jgi:hypothetical protein